MDFVEQSRALRSEYLSPLVKPLQKLGITANHLTALSFVFGLAAVWFLFSNHMYFVLFGALHLLADAFDGVLARATKTTLFGRHFDTFSDNILVVLIMIKSYVIFDHSFYAITALLYAVMLAVYFISKAPALFTRTITFIGYFLNLFALCAAVVAVVTVIGLLRQVYHFTFFKPKKKPM